MGGCVPAQGGVGSCCGPMAAMTLWMPVSGCIRAFASVLATMMMKLIGLVRTLDGLRPTRTGTGQPASAAEISGSQPTFLPCCLDPCPVPHHTHHTQCLLLCARQPCGPSHAPHRSSLSSGMRWDLPRSLLLTSATTGTLLSLNDNLCENCTVLQCLHVVSRRGYPGTISLPVCCWRCAAIAWPPLRRRVRAALADWRYISHTHTACASTMARGGMREESGVVSSRVAVVQLCDGLVDGGVTPSLGKLGMLPYLQTFTPIGRAGAAVQPTGADSKVCMRVLPVASWWPRLLFLHAVFAL